MPNIVVKDFKNEEREMQERLAREEEKFARIMRLHAIYSARLSDETYALLTELKKMFDELGEAFPYDHLINNSKYHRPQYKKNQDNDGQSDFSFDEPEFETFKEQEAEISNKKKKRDRPISENAKAIYRKCILLCHPDKNKSLSKEAAADYIALIKEAYEAGDVSALNRIYAELQQGAKESSLNNIKILERKLREIIVKNNSLCEHPLTMELLNEGVDKTIKKAITVMTDLALVMKLKLKSRRREQG